MKRVFTQYHVLLWQMTKGNMKQARCWGMMKDLIITAQYYTHVPATKFIPNSDYDLNVTRFRSLYPHFLAFTQKAFLWIIMLLIIFFIILIYNRYERGTSCHIYSCFHSSLSFYDTYCNLKQTSIWSAPVFMGNPCIYYFSCAFFVQSFSFLICCAK